MQSTGKAAEQHAKNWLIKQGLTLIDSNYHCRFGEIDLIMLDSKHLVFIEVRLRKNPNFGSAASSVTIHKQQKIITTANHFLKSNKVYGEHCCRFDVIAYESNSALTAPVWYKDAFRF